jgi:hypothetical protein
MRPNGITSDPDGRRWIVVAFDPFASETIPPKAREQGRENGIRIQDAGNSGRRRPVIPKEAPRRSHLGREPGGPTEESTLRSSKPAGVPHGPRTLLF